MPSLTQLDRKDRGLEQCALIARLYLLGRGAEHSADGLVEDRLEALLRQGGALQVLHLSFPDRYILTRLFSINFHPFIQGFQNTITACLRKGSSYNMSKQKMKCFISMYANLHRIFYLAYLGDI